MKARQTALHIGFLASDLGGGHGWSQASISVLRALLRRDDVRLTVVTTRNSPDFEDVPLLKALPDTVPPRRWTLARLAGAYAPVRHALRHCDVVHNMVEIYAPLGAWVAGARPYSMTCHGTYVHLPVMRRFPVNRLYEWAFRRAQCACVSHYTGRVLGGVVPDARVHVIPNAVESGRFGTVPAYEGRDAHTLISVGGVKPRKGTLELVQAVAEVREVVPDVRCIIIGRADDNAYTRRVRATIAQLNLADNVILAGFVDSERLKAYYAQATVFVMPSINHGYDFEGFGLVHLEASSVGLPVIGTSGCGIEDAIDDGETGLLVAQEGLAQDLPQAILRILQDPQTAQTMGMKGIRKAQAHTWDDVARALITLHREALGAPSGDIV